jgi:hypothetical protein
VDRVGIALVFPKEDVLLPSLYAAVAGDGPIRWTDEREDGKLELTPELARVWRWKDELAAERRVCAGKHVRGWPSLVSLAALPSLYSLTGRPGQVHDFRQAPLSTLEHEVAEVVAEAAPVSAPQVRRLLGTADTARVKRALDSLQRSLVVTRAGTLEQEQGWPGVAYDLLARRYGASLHPLPEEREARRHLATAVLRAARELSAADLAAALGFRRGEAATALKSLAVTGAALAREENGVAVWRPARRRASSADPSTGRPRT